MTGRLGSIDLSNICIALVRDDNKALVATAPCYGALLIPRRPETVAQSWTAPHREDHEESPGKNIELSQDAGLGRPLTKISNEGDDEAWKLLKELCMLDTNDTSKKCGLTFPRTR